MRVYRESNQPTTSFHNIKVGEVFRAEPHNQVYIKVDFVHEEDLQAEWAVGLEDGTMRPLPRSFLCTRFPGAYVVLNEGPQEC